MINSGRISNSNNFPTFTNPAPDVQWWILVVFAESVQQVVHVECSVNIYSFLYDAQYRPNMEVVCERVDVNEVFHTPTLSREEVGNLKEK